MQLAAEKLVLVRGARRVVDGLSFSVESGEALLLTGANGSGKTTVLRAIAGFLRPHSGSVRLLGQASGRDVCEAVHFVGHLDGLKSSLTVAENLAFWLAYLTGEDGSAASSAGAIDGALAALELQSLAAIPAGYLSAGQKRRVALARVLVVPRPVWLLDEPTSSLDDRSAGLLGNAIDAHLAAGGMALIATHLPMRLARSRHLRLPAIAEAA